MPTRIPVGVPFQIKGSPVVYLYETKNDTLFDVTKPDVPKVVCDGGINCDPKTCIVRNSDKFVFIRKEAR